MLKNILTDHHLKRQNLKRKTRNLHMLRQEEKKTQNISFQYVRDMYVHKCKYRNNVQDDGDVQIPVVDVGLFECYSKCMH